MTEQISETLAAPALPAGYTARPATLADAAALAGMLDRVDRTLLTMNMTAEEWRREWQGPGFQLEANTRLVLAPDGALAGYVHIWDPPPHIQLEQFGRMHPAHTGRGLGSWLLAWVEQRARQLMAQAPATARVVLTDWINSLDVEAVALLGQAGHQMMRTNWRMMIELEPDAPVRPPSWPEGVSWRSFVPGQDDRATLSVIRSAFRDHWGHVDSPFEEHLEQWTYFWRNDPDFDPSLWLLAVAGEEVIGTALCRRSIPEDPDCGWIFSLGILRAWRRRGIAGALLQQGFVRLQQLGRKRVALGVDADSLTNAVALYEKAGMHSDPTHTYQVWERELRPGAELSTTELEGK